MDVFFNLSFSLPISLLVCRFDSFSIILSPFLVLSVPLSLYISLSIFLSFLLSICLSLPHSLSISIPLLHPFGLFTSFEVCVVGGHVKQARVVVMFCIISVHMWVPVLIMLTYPYKYKRESTSYHQCNSMIKN